jgi:predicted nucleic acid-binding protein
MKLFVDTWGWITLYNHREARHQEINRYYRDFREQRGIAYTTDYVLDETFTLMFRRLSFHLASKFVQTLEIAIKEGYLNLEWITSERFEAAKTLRLKFQDKPDISFTDLTSMVVMTESGITQVATGDAHFSHVGLGFQLVP